MTQAATFVTGTFTPGAPDFSITIDENEQLTVMAKVRGPSGAFVQVADLSEVWLRTRKRADLSSTGPTALTASSVVFDTLQNDARWTEDGEGYNFRAVLDGATYFSDPGGYDVEFHFDEASGEAYFLKGFVTVRNTLVD